MRQPRVPIEILRTLVNSSEPLQPCNNVILMTSYGGGGPGFPVLPVLRMGHRPGISAHGLGASSTTAALAAVAVSSGTYMAQHGDQVLIPLQA